MFGEHFSRRGSPIPPISSKNYIIYNCKNEQYYKILFILYFFIFFLQNITFFSYKILYTFLNINKVHFYIVFHCAKKEYIKY